MVGETIILNTIQNPNWPNQTVENGQNKNDASRPHHLSPSHQDFKNAYQPSVQHIASIVSI